MIAALLIARALLRDPLVRFDIRVKWAEQYLQRYRVVAGGLAVGLLIFALRPLERAPERLAGALASGAMTDRERLMLATLADELGLTAREALEVERDARGAAAQG